MPYALNAQIVAQAFAAKPLTGHRGAVPIKVVEVGELVVTSQFVAASDPFVDPTPEPFTQKVPNGRHPVTLAIADFDTDERVAFARVQFSSRARGDFWAGRFRGNANC